MSHNLFSRAEMLTVEEGGNDSNGEADSCYRILKGTVIEGATIFQMKSRIRSEAENRVWLIECSYSKIHTQDTELGNSSGKRRGGSGGSQGQNQGNGWKCDDQRAREPALALPALRCVPTRLVAQLNVFLSAPPWGCCFKWSYCLFVSSVDTFITKLREWGLSWVEGAQGKKLGQR